MYTNTQLSPFEWAIRIADLQRSIIPVKLKGTNKVPYVKWIPYQSERASIQQIKQWQKEFNPIMWGQVTGSVSGIVTLDYDGDSGRQIMENLGIKPHRRTGSGGFQSDFVHPGWYVKTENSKSSAKKSWAQAYPGLDIRADGGLAVIAGKNSKGPYEWLRDPGDLDDLEILPTDLREWLGLLYPPESNVAERALKKYLAEAGYKGRDNACFELACQLRDNNYTQMEAESYCAEFAKRTHTTNQKGDREPFTEVDARTKVASAYSYAKRDPWGSTVPYRPHQEPASNGNGHTSPQPNQPKLETIIERLSENEYGDGLLFAEAFNGQVCYDHSEKAWYLWNKHHWKKDATGKVKRMVSGHLGSIYLKARGDIHKQIVDIQAEIENVAKEKGQEDKLTKLKNRLGYLGVLMEELEKRARALRGANRMKNVLTFAMSEHNIGITGEIWDADPWLLGVKNGVIDLRTGQLRDGYPLDYIRSISPTKWTGLNTPCPRFERFLQEIFEDKPEEQRQDLIAFLQRLLGYSITGLVSEHIFPIFYGEEGRNGKDTLFTLLKFVLSTAIANAVSNDVLLSTDKGRAAGAATPHLADLQGKRIVWGSETKQGDKFNVSQVKQLTGGGGIPARKNYGDQYTFDPTHTLFLMTNYRPHADAKDKAFWTRVCLIEFNLRFVDNPVETNERKADTNISKELETEASGILAWLVRGNLEYQGQGLNRPDIVKVATESYRASEDNIQQFIDECCVCHKNAHVGAQRLYDTYLIWCKNNNLNHINGRQFGEDVSKRFKKERKRTGLEYQKIGLSEDETPPEDPSGVGSKSTGVGSNMHPTHISKPAPEQVLDTTKNQDCVGCVGSIQESSGQLVREDSSLPLYGNTLHTLHTSSCEDDIKPPLEPREGYVKGQEAPYTPYTASLEVFWTIGKKHGYPEIPDLNLRAGMIGWNTFRLQHQLRIPDVVARLGGMT